MKSACVGVLSIIEYRTIILPVALGGCEFDLSHLCKNTKNMTEQCDVLYPHEINESLIPRFPPRLLLLQLLRRFAASERLAALRHNALLFPALTYPFILPVAI